MYKIVRRFFRRNPIVIPLLLLVATIAVCHAQQSCLWGYEPQHGHRKANAAQEWAYRQFEQAGVQQSELLAAMTVGRWDRQVYEKRNVYNVAGVSHILVLSGLHVGFVYAFVLTLAFRRRHNSLVVGATLGCVWAYVVLTGGAASTVRAALMVTLHGMAVMLRRPPMTVNCIAGAAFLILLVSPLQMYELGFLMSFGAVLSIVLFVPLLTPRLQNPIVKWMWGSMSVSLAAQLGVLPILLCVFQKFAVWFLLANIVVVLAAMVIVYLAFVVLLLALLPPLQSVVGYVLNIVLNTTDAFVGWVAELPCSSIDLAISTSQAVIMYVVLIAAAIIGHIIKMRLTQNFLPA